MKIRTKLSMFPIVLAIFLIVAFLITLIISRSTIRNQVGNHLLTTAQSRAEHIETLLHNYKEIVQILAVGIPFTNVLDPTIDIDYEERMMECDLIIQRTVEIDPNISRIGILNKNGIVINSCHEDIGSDLSEDTIYINGKEGVHVGVIHKSEYTENLAISISAPIFVRDKFSGVLVVNFDAGKQLYKITTDKTGLGKTGEIYLINKEGYIITPSRFIDDAILKKTINTEQANQYFSEHIKKGLPEFMEQEPFEYLDYRDNKVLGTHYFIPDLQWVLISEIDLEEANKPICKLTFWLIAIFSFLIIITIIFDITIYRDITLPIKELHEGTEEIINGNFDHKVSIETKNEIGQLSRAFDIMTGRLVESQKELQKHAEELDEKVKERTTELEKQFRKSEKQRLANLVIMNDLNRITKNLKSEISERKKTEKELIGSEERYRFLVTNLPVGIFRSTLQGKVISANTAMVEIYGYESVEELLSIPSEDYYTLRDSRETMLKELEKKGYLLEYETHEKRKDNSLIWVSTNYKKVWSEDDGIYYIDGVVANITERKQAEEEMQILAAVVKNSSELVNLSTLDGKMTFLNECGCKMLGIDPHEVENVNIMDVIPEHLIGLVKKELLPAFMKGGTWEGKLQYRNLKTGELTDVHAMTFTIKDPGTGEPQYFANVSLDITESKKSEKIQKALYDISNALNTTDNMYDLFSKIREFLGNVLDTTNFFVALFDEKTDMISLPFDVDEKDEIETFPAGKTLTKYVIQTGKSLFAPRQLQDELNKQGKIDIIGTRSKIWLGVPLKVENKVIGVIAVQSYDDPNLYSEDDIEMLTFVSEEIALAIKHKQADENIQKAHEELKGLHKDLQKKVNNTVEELREKDHILIQQSRHAAMGEMIGNIAHQWRQPLAMVAAIIQNYEDAYEDGTLDMAYIEKHTEVIMDILTKMSRTIDDFRYFFKPNKLKENFNIKDVIHKTLEFLESSLNFNQIKVSLELTADCVVQGFPNEYSQALLVILSNAKDELIERQIKAKQITILLNKIEDKYVLKISDNAGGITKEVLPKVFDPYFTTKEQGKGTGVGLYMAKMIIEKNMEGKLSAKNLKDGAEFRIEI